LIHELSYGSANLLLISFGIACHQIGINRYLTIMRQTLDRSSSFELYNPKCGAANVKAKKIRDATKNAHAVILA
jgi:hypothetical protein